MSMEIVKLPQLTQAEQFLKNFSSENTRRAYERDLEEYVNFSSGADPISFQTLIRYKEHLSGRSSSNTVIRKISTIKSFMSFLVAQGVIKDNPTSSLKMPKSVVSQPTEAFEDQEVNKILSLPDPSSFYGVVHKLCLNMLFHLGLRRSELTTLRVNSIKEHRGTKFLLIHGKGSKTRQVVLTKHLIDELDSYFSSYRQITGNSLYSEDFLVQSTPFIKNSQPMNPSTVYRMVTKYAREAGVTRRVSPHSCRATMISHLLEKEVSPRSVADIVGHSNIQTTVGIYDRKRDALNNKAVERVSYEEKV